jgi:tetratricopeptide (TPR) repeat protein
VIAILLAVCSMAWPAFQYYGHKVLYPRAVAKCWDQGQSVTVRLAACDQLIHRRNYSDRTKRRVLRGRAWAYNANGDYNLALADAEAVLAMQPDDIWGLDLRARMQWNLNQRDVAFADMDRAVALKPANAILVGRRGDLHARAGHFELAVRDYDAVLALKPKHFGSWKQRVRMFALQGDYDAALRYAQDAAQILPEEWWFNEALGHLYALHLNDDVRALNAFSGPECV